MEKYGSEKVHIWAYFMQCSYGASIADFELIVATQGVVLTTFGCCLLQNLEERKKHN